MGIEQPERRLNIIIAEGFSLFGEFERLLNVEIGSMIPSGFMSLSY